MLVSYMQRPVLDPLDSDPEEATFILTKDPLTKMCAGGTGAVTSRSTVRKHFLRPVL